VEASITRRGGVAALALLVFGLGLVVGYATLDTANAQPEVTIPVTTVVDDDPGTEHVMGEADLAAEGIAAGQTCQVMLVRNNNDSVHPDNDLRVVSGSNAVVFPDFEDTPGPIVEPPFGDVLVVDGVKVTVLLVLGSDGVSSGGFTVTLDCEPTPPPDDEPQPPIVVPPDAPPSPPQPAASPPRQAGAATPVTAEAAFTG
jgi:hypothetical protein